MTLQQIYDLCNYVAGKELTGNAFTPTQYNLTINSVKDEIKAEEYDAILKLKIQGDMKALSEYLLASVLRPFVLQTTINVGQDGSGDAPSDYERFLSAFIMYENNFRPVDLVGDIEFNTKRASVTSRPNVHPFGKLVNKKLWFIPYDLGSVIFTYLKKGTNPFLDFCQDATTLKPIFMPVGSYIGQHARTVTPPAGVPLNLYDSSNNVIANNVYKNGLATYDSKTVELEFEEYYHPRFISRILSKVGINLSEQAVSQWAEMQIKGGK